MRDKDKTKEQFMTESVEMRQWITELEASETKRKQAEKKLQICNHFSEITNQHTEMAPLLKEIVAEVKKFTGCTVVELRLLDEENSIPCKDYKGFSDEGGSFYINDAGHFLAQASEEEKEQSHNVCSQAGYESTTVIPVRFGDQLLGSIYVADPRENMIPLEKMDILEEIGRRLGTAIQRVHAAEALHNSKGWQETFDAVQDIVTLISPDFEFIKVNRAGCDALGVKHEELVGKKCYEVVHGLDAPLVGCPCAKMLETEEGGVGEIMQDGRYYIVTADPVFDEYGKLAAFSHTIKDVTERRQAEEALKEAYHELERRVDQRTHELLESNTLLQNEILERERTEEALWDTNELLETIFSTTHVMIAYLDRDFNFIRVNRAYAVANGRTPEFFIGQNYFDLYHNEYIKSVFRDVVSKGQPSFNYARPFEFAEDKESDWRYLDWSLHPVKDSFMNVNGLIMVCLDITERKRMEEQLRWSQKMESVGRLAAGVAHEIGNPLNSISSLAQLLQMKSKDAFVKDNLRLMGTHINRISKIVRSMMDFARPVGNRKKSAQVNDVLNTALEISKYDKRAKNIEIITELALNMQPVFLVRDQLLQVFTNIILNAFDAMQYGGRLIINARQESDGIHISFTDTGAGIREDTIGNIFDPFFTTKDTGQGTGLGLSISYGIIKSFGGEISVQSTYGSGSTFTVILPSKRIADCHGGGI